MATKTPAQILGVTPQNPRTAPAAPPNPAKTTNFQAWKSAITDANTVVGYDNTSPIHGKTDVEVLDVVRRKVESYFQDMGNGNEHVDIVQAHKLILELMKRKTARQIAGQAYKAAHKS